MDRRAVGGRPFRGMGDRELERERGNGAPLRDRERDRPLPLPRGGPPPGDFPRGFGRAGSGGAPMGMMGGRAGDYGPPPIGRPGGPRGGPPPGLPLVPQQPEFIVDREKTCPMLVRVWVKVGSHHDPQEFEVRRARARWPAADAAALVLSLGSWVDLQQAGMQRWLLSPHARPAGAGQGARRRHPHPHLARRHAARAHRPHPAGALL